MNNANRAACVFALCAGLVSFILPAAAQGSKSLGLGLPELSAIYGKPRTLHHESMPVYLYDMHGSGGLKYERALSAFAFTLRAPVPLADARRRAAQIIPTDARRIGLSKHGAQIVDVYCSAWLARNTAQNPFYAYGDAKPGTFIVVYTPAPGGIASFALYPGGGLD